MNAECRIGKTSILSVLNDAPPKGWVSVKRDLEGIGSAEEFATAIYKDVDAFLTKKRQAWRRIKEGLVSAGGTEIGGVLRFPGGKSIPWKTVLEESIQSLCASRESGEERLLFLWDEVPFMLEKISSAEGASTAMEVLDVLRFLRQTHPSLRMVLTGSIGLHHVLRNLRKSGYANAPVNDMYSFEVGPLSEDDGRDLATRLLKGEGIESPDRGLARSEISKLVDHFPFYIHQLVRRLRLDRLSAEVATIREVLTEQLNDADDPLGPQSLSIEDFDVLQGQRAVRYGHPRFHRRRVGTDVGGRNCTGDRRCFWRYRQRKSPPPAYLPATRSLPPTRFTVTFHV